MKRLLKWICLSILTPVVLIGVFLVLLVVLRVPICQGKILQPFRLWAHYICPPDDLYELVLKETIDITKSGHVQQFRFKAKYIGRYDGGILLDNFEHDLFNKNFQLRLRLKAKFFKNDDSFLFSKETTGEYSPFCGKRGNGFILFEFESPQGIPIDTEITCAITIAIEDKRLSGNYGPIKLYIQKMSEL